MEKINLLELKKMDTSKVEYTLLDSLRGLTDESHMHLKSIVCAYVINKMQTTMQYPNMETFLEEADLTNDKKKSFLKMRLIVGISLRQIYQNSHHLNC